MTTTYTPTGVCEFPGCGKPAPPVQAPCETGDCPSLCLEHDAHLFYDAAEFHRLWEQHDLTG